MRTRWYSSCVALFLLATICKIECLSTASGGNKTAAASLHNGVSGVEQPVTCKNDGDCQKTEYNSYCIDGICRKLRASGDFCSSAHDCASFFYHGAESCSEICPVETQCMAKRGSSIAESGRCCRPVPDGEVCLPPAVRRRHLSGCHSRSKCKLFSKGEYRCVPTNTYSYLYGVALALIGCTLINLGLNIQRVSHRIKSGILWHVGIALYILGKLSSFSAYLFGSQSLIATIGSFGLVANSIFAPLLNHEVFTKYDLFSIVLVASGSALIVYASDQPSKEYSLCELLDLYKTKDTAALFVAMALCLLAVYLYVKWVEANSSWDIVLSRYDKIYLTRRNALAMSSVHIKWAMPVAYVALAAIIGSLSTLIAKSVAVMLERTLEGENQFKHALAWLFIVLLVAGTALQVAWLNRGLSRYEALIEIPIYQVIWTLFSVLTAGIYFKDFEEFSQEQFISFVVGVVLCCSASILLMLRIKGRRR